LPFSQKKEVRADTGYLGIEKLHSNSILPKKSSKLRPLTLKEKRANLKLSKTRVKVEHVIGKIKVFKIMSERYRNRRNHHALRMNLICGIYNYELRN
jgi:hypothetical protein